MMENTFHPDDLALIQIDRPFQKVKSNSAVPFDRQPIVEISLSRTGGDTRSENESIELSEKPLPICTTPPPLLILDLNGCILYRQYVPGRDRIIKPRPYLDELFQYIFAPNSKDAKHPNWELMIWSSAQPRNVELMLQALNMSKRPLQAQTPRRGRRDPPNLLNDISNRVDSLSLARSPPASDKIAKKPIERTVIDVWDRSTLDLSSEDYVRNVSTTKDLRKAWDKFSWTDPSTNEKLKWGPHNTVIVDDSPRKITLQPDNLCLVEEFKGDPNDTGLLELIETLKSLRDESNIAEALGNLKRQKTDTGLKEERTT